MKLLSHPVFFIQTPSHLVIDGCIVTNWDVVPVVGIGLGSTWLITLTVESLARGVVVGIVLPVVVGDDDIVVGDDVVPLVGILHKYKLLRL